MSITDAAFDLLVAEVKTKLAREEVTFATGERARSEHGNPPRVVWVPVGGVIGAPPKTGPIIDPSNPARLIETLYSAKLNVEAHIWCENLAKLESLWVRVLGATRKALIGASVPGAFRFDTQDSRAGFVHGDYEKLTQLFTWDLLLARATDRTVQTGSITHAENLTIIQTTTHTCVIDNNLTIP